MKTAKKLLSLFIAMVISIGILTACGGEPITLLDFIGEPISDEDLDFKGYEFIIYNGEDPEYGASVTGDAILQRYKDVEAYYNVDIVIKENLESDWSKQIFSAKASGIKYCDIFNTSNERLYECYNSNLLLPVNNFAGLDLNSGIFGSEGMLEAIRFPDGNIYGFQAEQWPNMPKINLINFVCYNPVLIKTYNLENPQEILENDQWDWETFRQMAISATVLTENKYGIVSEHDDFPVNAIFSNDGAIVKYNEQTGKYYNGLLDDDAIEAIEWTQKLVQEDECLYIEDTDISENWMFTNGDALFWVTGINYVFKTDEEKSSPLVHMTDGFDFVSFPYGPRNEDHSWNPKSNMYSEYYAIPDSIDFDETIVISVINKIFQPIEDQMDWRDYYTQYMMPGNEKSTEIFLKLLDEIETSNLHIFEIATRVEYIVDNLKTLSQNPGSVVEAFQPTYDILQESIDKAFNE